MVSLYQLSQIGFKENGEETQPLALVVHTSPWPLPLQASDVKSLLGILDTSSPPSTVTLATGHSLGCFVKLLLLSEGGWLQAKASLVRLSASCNYHAGFEEPFLPFQLQGKAEILMKKGSLSAGPALPLAVCSDGPSSCDSLDGLGCCSEPGEPGF